MVPGSITSASYNMNGFIGGGQAGYNWQTNNWVWGIEGDIDGNVIYSRDYAAGVNSIFNYDLPPLYGIGAWGATTYDRGFATYVDVVPEPASWALMIAGFGLVGGALRRRTAVAA